MNKLNTPPPPVVLAFKSPRSKAFTLIELLVVVLIIGICAAVALPQYQKSVWKSRTAQLQLLLRDLYQAEERYFLANNSYAATFSELDIDFPSMANTSFSAFGWGVNEKLGNDNFGLMIDAVNGRVFAVFLTGKYKGGTFVHILKNGSGIGTSIGRGRTFCAEVISQPAYEEKFCNRVAGINAEALSIDNGRYYPIP